MKLRSKLLLLTMQAALPPMLLCLVVGGVLVNYERESFRRGVTDSNRAFMTAVDAEVRGHMSTLTALAASTNLEADKLPAFREERSKRRTQPGAFPSRTPAPTTSDIMVTDYYCTNCQRTVTFTVT